MSGKTKVLVIGLDCAGPELVFDRFKDELPNLSAMMDNGIYGELKGRGFKIELLDGDWVRKTINVDAGFTFEERRRHLLRVAWIARLLARNGTIVLCSFVSPYRSVRAKIRKIVEEEAPFIEVFVRCSLEEAMRRDPKGL